MADIVHAHGAAFRATHALCSVQHRALTAIERCRTAALGGELRACDACGDRRYVYHSCRNRHCPKCQTRAKETWLAARRAELLPVPYFHLVFTLPHELNALAQGNPHAVYTMLFAAAAAGNCIRGETPQTGVSNFRFRPPRRVYQNSDSVDTRTTRKAQGAGS